MAEQYGNALRSTIVGGIGTGTLSVTIASSTGWPATGDFRCLICVPGDPPTNAEIVKATARSGNVLTIERAAEPWNGVQGAFAHAAGETIVLVLTEESLRAIETSFIVTDEDESPLVTATEIEFVYDAVYPGAYSYLPASNGVDDTAVIQAALDAARLTYEQSLVKGLPGENYLITTIIIGSFTTLDMTGCTVTQIDGTNDNMLRNWALAGAKTIQDANITAGDTTLTSATANFQPGDDEKNVRVWGADQGGEYLVDTIQSVTNSTTVELYVPAVTTVTNGQATIGQWDTDIFIIGGRWDRGNNGRIFLPAVDGIEASGFAMRIRRVDKVTCRDLTFTGGNAEACTALCFGDATNFVADNIAADTYLSGLVQASGPARYGSFSNIYGRCTDDLAALLAMDWPGVRDVYGNISYITFENIHSEWCDGSLLILIPGSASFGISTEHIYVRNVYGRDTNSTQHQGGLVWIGDTAAFPELAGGFIDDIVIENLSGEPMGDYDDSRGLVWLVSPNAGRIRLSGLNIHSPTGMTRHGVILGPDSDIGLLCIHDSVISSIDGGCDLINYDLAAGAVIQNLDLLHNAYRVNGVWELITDADSPTYEETVLSIPDLVVYYRLGESSGTIANDTSPNNLDGTINNGTLGTTGLLAGDIGTAWTGNGTNSSVVAPTIPAQAEWTIVWWEKSNGANPDYAAIFATPGDRLDIARVVSGGTQPGQLWYYDGGGWRGNLEWTVDTTPTMLALSFDGTDIRMWKNGTQAGATDTGFGRSLLNAAFTIGAFVGGGTPGIDTLQEFAVYGRALDSSEIAQLYTVGT